MRPALERYGGLIRREETSDRSRATTESSRCSAGALGFVYHRDVFEHCGSNNLGKRSLFLIYQLLVWSENQPAEMDFEAAKLKDFGQEMGGAGETSASRSKPRMVWSNDLNNKFLEAIRALGHKASPKDIAEFMGVPGLSRRLVASHLQDFLRSEKDPINRDVSILGSGGLLGLQYLTPSIRQYQEPWARISSAVNLNFSSNLNRVSQANLLLSAGSGSSSSPTVGLMNGVNSGQTLNLGRKYVLP